MSRIRGLKTFLLVGIFVLAVPFYVFAEEIDNGSVEGLDTGIVELYGVGEWDYKGQENIIFQYTKETITKGYYATDGGNFKMDITSNSLKSNAVTAEIYINGNYGGTKGVAYGNGKGTIQFSNIPKGARVWFHITVANYDAINFKFYD